MIEHEGRIYVPCGYRNTWLGRLWKQWPLEVQDDPRAIVRVEGKRYERTLIAVTSKHPAIEALLAELQRKYVGGGTSTPPGIVDTDALLLFELAPRSS